jgi:hypothetical protein
VGYATRVIFTPPYVPCMVFWVASLLAHATLFSAGLSAHYFNVWTLVATTLSLFALATEAPRARR